MVAFKKTQKCYCEYDKNGELKGLCLRCFKMSNEKLRSERKRLIKKIKEWVKESKEVDFSGDWFIFVSDLEQFLKEL